jgi:hypothetical protein
VATCDPPKTAGRVVSPVSRNLTVGVPVPTYVAFQLKAARERRSLADVMRALIAGYLASPEPPDDLAS